VNRRPNRPVRSQNSDTSRLIFDALGDGATAELARRTRVLPVRLTLADEAAFKALLVERIAHARSRGFGRMG